MKAHVFQGTNKHKLINKSKPEILMPTDAIIKITHTTICGTDLHILNGDVPEVVENLTLGHEGVGIVEQVGNSVTKFKAGDRVLISCITSCGSCEFCKKSLPAHCTDGGWLLGHLIDGTQAEYARIPHASNSLHLIPDNMDEEALVMLSDIFPTGFEIGVLAGKVSPGSTVAIVGAGPIGLAALLTAQFYSPEEIIMIDIDDYRLEIAKKFGATKCINSSDGHVVEKVLEITGTRGVDIAMEAVGIPETFDICQKIIGVGGNIANIGVHGKSVNLDLEKLWIKNIVISTGLVNTTSTPLLIKNVKSGKLIPNKLITHHFKLDDILSAYEIFGNADKNQALKVIIKT